jgi:serine/threonine protein kinase
MSTGSAPFEGESEKEIFYDILYAPLEYPEYMSKSLSNLIKKLMNKDPKERLGHNNGIEEILEHRFFSGTPIIDILRGVTSPPIVPQLFKQSSQIDSTSVAQLN